MLRRSNPRPDPAIPRDPLETHYTIRQIAEKWGVDAETVRQAFIDEEGVLILGDQSRHDGKRAYLTLRIPESVLHRVYAQRTKRESAFGRPAAQRRPAAHNLGVSFTRRKRKAKHNDDSKLEAAN